MTHWWIKFQVDYLKNVFFSLNLSYKIILKKAAGYYRHIFRPPILMKMPFERMKTFFFQLKIFYFFSKRTSQLKRKRPFQEIISFDSHSTANLPPLPILMKIRFVLKIRWWKIFKVRIVRTFCWDNWQVNVKKRTALSGWFSFQIINMGGK